MARLACTPAPHADEREKLERLCSDNENLVDLLNCFGEAIGSKKTTNGRSEARMTNLPYNVGLAIELLPPWAIGSAYEAIPRCIATRLTESGVTHYVSGAQACQRVSA